MGTTANGIFYPDTSYLNGWRQADQDQADSIDTFLTARSIQSFRVANSASLTALASQFTLQVDDRAYQIDTGVTHRHNGVTWKPWESDWITYAATLSAAGGTFSVGTGGSASSSTRYRYVGGRIRLDFQFILGTSGASVGTSPKFTLPQPIGTLPHVYAVYGTSGDMFDASSSILRISAVLADDSSTTVVRPAYLDNISGLYEFPTATTPWTWAAGDIMRGSLDYEPA
jgi:hypothetical protein